MKTQTARVETFKNMVTLQLNSKNIEKLDLIKFPMNGLKYFIKHLKGNWVAKITKYGNIKFCETDNSGEILHPNVFYTLYYDYIKGFYFRRAIPSGYYQLFRSYKCTEIKPTAQGWYINNVEEWKHFNNIEIAVENFNRYYEQCTYGSLKHYQWTHNSFLCTYKNGKLAKTVKLTDWKIRF